MSLEKKQTIVEIQLVQNMFHCLEQMREKGFELGSSFQML